MRRNWKRPSKGPRVRSQCPHAPGCLLAQPLPFLGHLAVQPPSLLLQGSLLLLQVLLKPAGWWGLVHMGRARSPRTLLPRHRCGPGRRSWGEGATGHTSHRHWIDSPSWGRETEQRGHAPHQSSYNATCPRVGGFGAPVKVRTSDRATNPICLSEESLTTPVGGG